MLRSWKIGSAFGIGIHIHITFLLLPALLLVSHWGDPLVLQGFVQILLLATFTCVVLHELGHALMARYFGIRTLDITLYPIGGVARLERLNDRPIEEFWIALAGPAVNVIIVLLLTPLLIGGVSLMEEPPTDLVAALQGEYGWLGRVLPLVGSLWLANAVLILFNLLPTFPMDGGRVLRSLLAWKMGLLRGTQIAVITGRLVTMGALFLLALFASGFLLKNPMLLVVAFFVILAGQRELNAIRRQERDRRLAQSEAPSVTEETSWPALDAAPPGFSGFTWDQEQRLCVHWLAGRPVGVFFIPVRPMPPG